MFNWQNHTNFAFITEFSASYKDSMNHKKSKTQRLCEFRIFWTAFSAPTDATSNRAPLGRGAVDFRRHNSFFVDKSKVVVV